MESAGRNAAGAAALPLGPDALARVCHGVLRERLSAARGGGVAPVPPSAPLVDRHGAEALPGGPALDSLELLETVSDLDRRFALHRTGIEDHFLLQPSLERWGALLAEHLRRVGPDLALTFFTSGSTGAPRPVTHAASALLSEVDALLAALWPDRFPDRYADHVPVKRPDGGERPCAIDRDGATAPPALQITQEPSDFGVTGVTGIPGEAKPGSPSNSPSDAVARASDAPDAPCLSGLPGRPARILALVPAHHVYGFLFTALLPARAGLPVADLVGRAPGALAGSASPGDVIVATPYALALALASGARLPDGVEAIVSGAPAPPELWAAAARADLPLAEVYGATETGGIGWRRSGTEPFTLLPHLTRGADARAPDDAPESASAELSVTPAAPRQEPVPVLPVSAAPGSSADVPGGDALPLQDHLEWVGPSRFFVRGRRDGVVQVGGVNVAPAAVARHLEALDEVATAAVRLDLRTGRLKAFVVPEPRAYGAAPSPDGERSSTERSKPHPRPDPSCAAVPSQHDPALEARLRAAVAALPAPARPQSYTFGAALPISPAGKPTDWIVPS